MSSDQPIDPNDPAVLERVRAATDLLETFANDRQILSDMPFEVRKRLLTAVTRVFNPSPSARRNMVKASKRRWKAARAEEKDAVKQDVGIRVLRRQPVFTTPNVFPEGTARVAAGRRRRRAARITALLRVQEALHEAASLLRSDVPGVR